MLVPSKDLARATAYAARAISARPNPPVMAAMRVAASGRYLAFEGVGDDIYASVQLELDSDEDWSRLVGGRRLAGVAARLSGEVDVAAGDAGTALTLRAGRECYSFPALDPLGWPQPAAMPPVIGEVDPMALVEALQACGAACDSQSANPAQTFVRINVSGVDLRLQGFRSAIAARATVDWVAADCDELDLYVDADALAGLLRECADPTVTLCADDGRLGICGAGFWASIRLGAVQHPRFDRAFREHEYSIEVDRADLHDAVDKLLLFCENQFPRIALEPAPDELRLEAFGREERADIAVDATYDGPDGARFGVNPAYLKTCINSIRDTRLRILVNPAVAAAPLLFVSQNDADHMVALVPVQASEVSR